MIFVIYVIVAALTKNSGTLRFPSSSIALLLRSPGLYWSDPNGEQHQLKLFEETFFYISLLVLKNSKDAKAKFPLKITILTEQLRLRKIELNVEMYILTRFPHLWNFSSQAE